MDFAVLKLIDWRIADFGISGLQRCVVVVVVGIPGLCCRYGSFNGDGLASWDDFGLPSLCSRGACLLTPQPPMTSITLNLIQ